MENKLHISVSPHIHGKKTTMGIMLDVIIALLPTTIAGIIIFGLRSLLVIGVCLATSVLSELLFNIITKRKQTISDLSSVVTGLILALNLPANVPVWQAVIGSAFAIIVVKCLFGGLGKNVVNPALTARVFMLVAFSSLAQVSFPVDATAGATPLVSIAEGNVPDLMDLFLGKTGGSIGETCSLALLIGGIYLLIRKVITWQIPVAFIGTVFVFSFFVQDFNATTALASVLSGGLLLGAFFMATDYVTRPVTKLGQDIYGIILGLLTGIFRIYGPSAEGVSYAIIISNLLVPIIEKYTMPKPFGKGGERR